MQESLYSLIVKRAQKDDEFKKQLVSEPRSAIENGFGVTLQPDLIINVIVEAKGERHIVLPWGDEPDIQVETRDEPGVKRRWW